MREALLIPVLLVAAACGGKSEQKAAPGPPATTPATARATSSSSAEPDQSDYYAATSCKLYADIETRLRKGAGSDLAAEEAGSVTGSAGNAMDLSGSKWTDLKTAMDAWRAAIPDAAKRVEATRAVQPQCQKVPASLAKPVEILPSG